MKKRILSIITAAVMLLTFTSFSAFATDIMLYSHDFLTQGNDTENWDTAFYNASTGLYEPWTYNATSTSTNSQFDNSGLYAAENLSPLSVAVLRKALPSDYTISGEYALEISTPYELISIGNHVTNDNNSITIDHNKFYIMVQDSKLTLGKVDAEHPSGLTLKTTNSSRGHLYNLLHKFTLTVSGGQLSFHIENGKDASYCNDLTYDLTEGGTQTVDTTGYFGMECKEAKAIKNLYVTCPPSTYTAPENTICDVDFTTANADRSDWSTFSYDGVEFVPWEHITTSTNPDGYDNTGLYTTANGVKSSFAFLETPINNDFTAEGVLKMKSNNYNISLGAQYAVQNDGSIVLDAKYSIAITGNGYARLYKKGVTEPLLSGSNVIWDTKHHFVLSVKNGILKFYIENAVDNRYNETLTYDLTEGGTVTPDISGKMAFYSKNWLSIAELKVTALQHVSGVTLVAAPNGSSVSCELQAYNSCSSSAPLTAVIGLYDTNGTLIGVDFATKSLTNGMNVVEKTVTFDNTVYEFSYAKAFLLQSTGSLTPYCTPVTSY